MKTLLLALMASAAALHTLAQNLVPNPSFEEYLECPFSTAELDNQVVDWFSWSDSPDFFHECSNDLDGFAGIPANTFGYQWPMTGSGYAGVSTFMFIDPNLREYLAAPLLEPLVAGQSYYVAFHASLYDGGSKKNLVCATNHLGLRFFKDPTYNYFPPDQAFQPDNFAHIDYTEVLTDSVNWTRIEGTFTADENYNWIAIGNFFTDENTVTQIMNESGLCGSLYYIENICVASDQTACEYLLTSLQVSQSSDFVATLFPNPAANQFRFNSTSMTYYDLAIYDLTGRLVKTMNKVHPGQEVDVSTFQKGVYVVRVSDDQNFTTIKLIIQ